jgi:hypothetical protein
MSTPMSMAMSLGPDEDGEVVDQRGYSSMIGSLIYLTVTQPGIQFVVCLCARYVCSHYSQIPWIVHTVREFGVSFERVALMCDNTRGISVTKNTVFHKRLRHLERIHHFLRDHVEKGDIEMRYIDIERQLVDIFTKPLDSSRFANLWGGVGVCHPYGLV